MSAVRDCIVYKARTPKKIYIGVTSRTLDARQEDLVARPVHWLQGEDLKRLCLEAMFSQRVDMQTALTLEAAFTALEWSSAQNVVRGGPFCYSRLTSVMQSELQGLVVALKGKRSLQDRHRAVIDVSGDFAHSGPLGRHLRNQCFKCGKLWGLCCCRGFHWLDSGLEAKRDRSKEIADRRRQRQQDKRQGKQLKDRDRSKEIAARRGKNRSLESPNRRRPQSLRKRPSGRSGTSDSRSGSARRAAKRDRSGSRKQ